MEPNNEISNTIIALEMLEIATNRRCAHHYVKHLGIAMGSRKYSSVHTNAGVRNYV